MAGVGFDPNLKDRPLRFGSTKPFAAHSSTHLSASRSILFFAPSVRPIRVTNVTFAMSRARATRGPTASTFNSLTSHEGKGTR